MKSVATLVLAIKRTGSEALSKTVTTLKKIGQVGLVAFAALGTGIAASLKAYREQELSVNKLNQSLINQGIYSKSLSNDYQKMASELQKVTTFGDEAIISAQAQLQAYAGQNKITKDLTKSILDFATAQGMDLQAAAALVGKSIGTSTNALTRYGIEIDSSASKSDKMKAVTEALSEKFGGQAEAAAEGLGSIVQLKNALGDFLETIGKSIAPVVTRIVQKMTAMTESLNESSAAVQLIKNGFKGAIIVISVFKNVVMGYINTISGSLGVLAGALSQFISGQFAATWTSLKEGFTEVGEDLKERKTILNEELDAIDMLFAEKKNTDRADELKRIKASNKQKIKIQQEQTKNELKEDKKKKESLMLSAKDFANFETLLGSQKISNAQSVFSQIATLQNSHSKTMVAIGKAAGIANAIINTARGVTLALATFPPPWGTAMAAAVGVAGAAQIATISGVKLAEGGIVMPTAGGTPAIIGEAGKPEAVIPLDDANSPIGNTNINITVNGGMLGTQAEAREFAVAVDQELFNLRKNNESLAFDTGLI